MLARVTRNWIFDTFLVGMQNDIATLKSVWGFPGGVVVGGPPAGAGDTGSNPGMGGSRMLRGDWACASRLLSLCSGAREPRLLGLCAVTAEACTPGVHAPRRERPPQWGACAPRRGVAPSCGSWRGPARSKKKKPNIARNE